MLSKERLDEIKELERVTTYGPWQWYGNTKSHDMYLSTVQGGRKFVMTFKRWGMRSAQPMFQQKGYMFDAKGLVIYEKDYRKDFIGIDNPDAKFIAESRTMVAELLDHVYEQEAEVERLKRKVADKGSLNAEKNKHKVSMQTAQQDKELLCDEIERLRTDYANAVHRAMEYNERLLEIQQAARDLLTVNEPNDCTCYLKPNSERHPERAAAFVCVYCSREKRLRELLESDDSDCPDCEPDKPCGLCDKDAGSEGE